MKTRRITTYIGMGLFGLLLSILIARSFLSGTSTAAAHVSLPIPSGVALASPGRIEGRTDAIAVGAASDGVIQRIRVKEGEAVTRGQVIAEIGCADLELAQRVSTAEAESLRQQRARLIRGSRVEERQAAAQKAAAAKAVREQAAAQLERITKLYEALAVSKAAYDEARRDYDVAEAGFKAAARNEELVNATPLPEEIQRADADVLAAEDRIRVAEEKFAKCVVRAPISGTILRVFLREGESFSTFAPRPLFSIADISARRVRAEVDERDIGKLKIGQKVLISVPSGGAQFTGRVSQLASSMGRKSVHTGDPVDKQDRDVLEALADLEQASVALPIGLRVTVQFIPADQ